MICAIRVDTLALVSTRIGFAFIDIELTMLSVVARLACAAISTIYVNTSSIVVARVDFAFV